MKTFIQWLETFSTGGKIGLYPPIEDALGQYPPLYATARIPDVVTYIDIAYKGKSPSGVNGIINYGGKDLRISSHKKKHSVWNHPRSLGEPETAL